MKTVLFIGSHPDDIEFGCAGVIQHYQARKYKVVFAVLSNGEEGTHNSTKMNIKSIRKNEALKAAKVLGINNLHFLNFPDGITYVSKEMKSQLITLIRDIKPDIVYTHSTQDHFPDHQIYSKLSIESINAAAGPWYPEAIGKPHKVDQIYGFEVWNPCNHFQVAIDITSYIKKKVESLNQHRSQMESIDYQDAAKSLARYRGVMTGAGKYVEVFEVIKGQL